MKGIRLKKGKGFTLVELLVVMAIIGILATVSLGYFRTSQIKGRDARRKHDLGQIQKALEMYYSDHNLYPRTLPFGGQLKDVSNTVYMQKVPQDPQGDDYCYEVADGLIGYYLYSRLENKNDPVFQTYSCGSEEYNYHYRVSSSNMP